MIIVNYQIWLSVCFEMVIDFYYIGPKDWLKLITLKNKQIYYMLLKKLKWWICERFSRDATKECIEENVNQRIDL